MKTNGTTRHFSITHHIFKRKLNYKIFHSIQSIIDPQSLFLNIYMMDSNLKRETSKTSGVMDTMDRGLNESSDFSHRSPFSTGKQEENTREKCPICNEWFADIGLHVNSHFPENTTSNEDRKLEECNICDQIMLSTDIQDHLLAHELEQHESPSKKPRMSARVDLKCPSCGQNVPLIELESHELAHSLEQPGSSANNSVPKTEIVVNTARETDSQRLFAMYSKWIGRSGLKVGKCVICSGCNHYPSEKSDKGWSCGYRNLQMLISSLLAIEQYSTKAFQGKIPSIQEIQTMLENAWKNGFDKLGAKQLKGKVFGTRKWIGASDVAACLRSLGIRASLHDFPEGLPSLVTTLFDFIKRYFDQPRPYTHPIYLQFKGHSITVVGYEEKDQCFDLLIFDPSASNYQFKKGLENGNFSLFKKPKKWFEKRNEFQLLIVEDNHKALLMHGFELEQSKVLDSKRH